MNKQERAQRTALLMFFSIVVFCALLISLALTGVLVYMFNRWGIFIPDGQMELGSGRAILLMVGLSLFIGTALTVAVIRIPLNPINSLINGMRKLAQGDYKARIDMGRIIGKRAVGNELIDTFNILATELENTEMLRSDFINNFSHEFKTPIVSITGFAKLLRRGNLSEEQKAEYLAIIEEESMRLSYMATNVLNLTKIENQTILSDLSEYNLSEQLRTCVLVLESKWEKKHIELSLEFDEHTVYASEELMKQVWINLIDNAIKFSPEGGKVKLTVTESCDSICVSIANEGREIPEESRKKIFNKFYQGDESHSSQGNGIGLAVVKRITELHNGRVSVDSQNGYNVFTVSLPKPVVTADIME